VLIPKTVRYGNERSKSPASSSDEDSVHVPHADVLVETYQAGESMIRYINSVNAAADAARKNGAAVDAKQIALNKEIAALGLDAILKMVRLLSNSMCYCGAFIDLMFLFMIFFAVTVV